MIRKSILEKINNKDGAALITVLVIFLTLVVIVTASTQAAVGNYKRAKKSSDTSSALYVAEAGLFEIDEKIINYFNENYNEEGFDFREGFIDGFLNSIYETNPIEITYGLIMNQEAKSSITFTYDTENSTNDKQLFLLKSTGSIGNDKRTVQKTYEIDVMEKTISESNVLQPGGTVALDISGNSVFEFPPDSHSPVALDTLVTNQVVSIKKHSSVGKLKGPIVTNNRIEFARDWSKVSWLDGLVITSNIIDVKMHLTELSMRAIIFKPEKEYISGDKESGFIYNYHHDKSYINLNHTKPINEIISKLNVKYVFIPNDGNEDDYFRVNHIPSTALKNFFLSNGTTIIKYNPKNFNPYENTTSPQMDRMYVFGENPDNYEKDDPNRPKLDYRDYFDEEFVLDNMHREDLVHKYSPRVKMPDKKPYDDLYPIENHVNETIIGKKDWNSGNKVIDGNGNMNLNVPYSQDQSYLDLTKVAQSYGSKTLPFNKIYMGKGDDNLPATVYVGDENIVLVTKSFELKERLHVVAGKGSLEIVVIGSFPKLASSDFDVNYIEVAIKDKIDSTTKIYKPTKFRLFVYETEKSTDFKSARGDSGVTFTGTVFSQNLNANIGSAFDGNFISAEGTSINIQNAGQQAGTQLIYAPQAKLKMQGGKIEGVIVAKEYDFENSAPVLIFNPEFLQSLIDELENPIFDQEDMSSSDGGTIIIEGSLDGNNIIQEVDE